MYIGSVWLVMETLTYQVALKSLEHRVKVRFFEFVNKLTLYNSKETREVFNVAEEIHTKARELMRICARSPIGKHSPRANNASPSNLQQPSQQQQQKQQFSPRKNVEVQQPKRINDVNQVPELYRTKTPVNLKPWYESNPHVLEGILNTKEFVEEMQWQTQLRQKARERWEKILEESQKEFWEESLKTLREKNQKELKEMSPMRRIRPEEYSTSKAMPFKNYEEYLRGKKHFLHKNNNEPTLAISSEPVFDRPLPHHYGRKNCK